MIPPDAYFAGLIDGEGYVAVAKQHGMKKRQRPVIKITLTDHAVLKLCQQRFGGFIAPKRPNREKPHYKKAWYWQLTGQKAKDAAKPLIPFCVIKREGLLDILAWKPIDIRRYITAKGQRLSMIEWSKRSHIPYRTIQARLQVGWNPSLAVTIRPAYENGLRRLYRHHR
jgi:hypothetical protein